MWDTVPIWYKSFSSGRSTLISRWVTRKTSCSPSMARSRAAMEIGRSTSKVRFIRGKTVRPRRARTGIFIVVGSIGVIWFTLLSRGWE